MTSSGFTAWKEKELYNSECFSRIFITLGWFWCVDMASSADIMGSGGPISEAILTKHLLKISATSHGSVTVWSFSLSMIVLLPLNFLSVKKVFSVAQKFLREIIFNRLFSYGHNSVSFPSVFFPVALCLAPATLVAQWLDAPCWPRRL